MPASTVSNYLPSHSQKYQAHDIKHKQSQWHSQQASWIELPTAPFCRIKPTERSKLAIAFLVHILHALDSGEAPLDGYDANDGLDGHYYGEDIQNCFVLLVNGCKVSRSQR